MAAKSELARETGDREILATRILDAPRELVYRMWTDPYHLAQWWGPRGFTTTVKEMHVKPGGVWRLVMRGPDGRDDHNRIVFLEVLKPERLVYKHDPEPGSEPVNFEVTVTFAADGAKTKLTMRMLFPSAAARDHVVKTYGAVEGLNQTLGRLEEMLAGMLREAGKEVTLARTFDAPRELVFKAWTEGERLRHWWGPRGFTNPVCEVDARAGGAIRIHMRGPTGAIYPLTGTFEDIVAPERIVFTANALDEAGEPLFQVVTTVTFAETAGQRKLTVHQRVTKIFNPIAAASVAGMDEGWSQTLDRLADQVAGSAQKHFAIERTFNAPRSLVWKTLTEPERLKHWWGPKGFDWVRGTLDLRPGGLFHYCVRAPNGMEVWGKFVYREIAEPERLGFVNSFSDGEGGTTRHPRAPAWPREVLNFLTLTEENAKTTIRMRGYPINATTEERATFEAGFESMRGGFGGTFDQLEAYLANG
jgi:uncharacterized protein YndB with AHSA1/START domain